MDDNKDLSQQKLFYENVPIPIQFMDKDWCITNVNPYWLKVMGYEKAQIIAKSFINLLIEDDRQRIKSILEELNSSDRTFSFVCSLKHKNGKPIYAGFDGTLYSDPETGEKTIFSAFKDITNTIGLQSATKDALKKSEDRFKELQDNIVIGIFRVAPDGKILYANPALMKIFGAKDPSKLIGHSSKEFYAKPEERDSLLEILSENPDKRVSKEIEFQGLDGGSFWGRLNVKAVYDENGTMLFRDGSIEDISIIKKAEEELITAKNRAVKADHLKSSFLANMSHEIRTPMNAILGFSELLSDPDIPENQKSGFSTLINNNGTILMNLIDDIIDISKIEAGETTINKAKCQVYSILLDLELQFKEKIKLHGKSINLSLIADPELKGLSIISDSFRIRQIMTNLLDNALKFTKEGEISYGLKIQHSVNNHNRLCLFVQDSGIGIPRELHEVVFEQFRQVDQSPTRKYGGTGLGLHICKRLVELLGGEIILESKLGQGALFKVLLDLPK